jgi:integrase
MAREAVGELRKLALGYEARITIKGRSRRSFLLVTCQTEAEAVERKTAMAQFGARLRRAGQTTELVKILEMAARARPGRQWEFVVSAVDHLCAGTTEATALVPTFKDFAKLWTSGDLHKRHKDHVKDKDSENDKELLRVYIEPHVGDVRLDEFTLEDAELVMSKLPDVSKNTGRPLSAATRRHVAQVMGRIMNLAVYPGRWRKESPIPRGWLPHPGPAKAKECLYPDEDAKLLCGKAAQTGKRDVPLLRRLAYGFLDREGMRVDEMVNLRWSDVDLARGRVVLDENKTDDPRDWDLREDVVQALEAWKEHHCPNAEPTDHVFAEQGVPLSVDHLADQLRADLERVGVDRPQLFERSASRQPLRAHDLRATFITISLATGKTETHVMDRTGHTTSGMVNRYRRKARSWRLGELGPLNTCLPELAHCPPHCPRNHSRRWRNWQTRQIQVLVGLLL